ncbi:MAG: hypothetical protein ACRD1E_00180, partial [Terriglobales bacterium]
MPSTDSTPSHRLRSLAIVIVIAAAGALGYAWFRGAAPIITAVDVPAAVGLHKLVEVSVAAPVGVGAVTASMEQGGKTVLLG